MQSPENIDKVNENMSNSQSNDTPKEQAQSATTSSEFSVKIEAVPSVNEEIQKRSAAFYAKLKPGYIWKNKELKDQLKEEEVHLNPRVALVKLKHDESYHEELKNVRQIDDDPELTRLLKKVDKNFKNVIQLGPGLEAALQPNGEPLILPTDFRQRAEARRNKPCNWAQESIWRPEKKPCGRKLNIEGVKFGKSIGKTRLVIEKLVDPA